MTVAAKLPIFQYTKQKLRTPNLTIKSENPLDGWAKYYYKYIEFIHDDGLTIILSILYYRVDCKK